MTRLESEPQSINSPAQEPVTTPKYDVVRDEANPQHQQPLLVKPLTLRKQALAEFDAEFRLDQQIQNNARFELRHSASSEISESLINARALIKEGEYQLAHSLFRAILKADSMNEVAIRGAAECARQLGQHEEAIHVLKKLVDTHKSPHNFLLLADELYGLEYNVDALESYMRAAAGITEESTLFHIYKNIGNVQLRLGDLDAAEEFYNKAYTIDPDSDVLLTNFGSLELYRGHLEKSLSRFREAVSLNDRNDKAWVGLAMIHRQYSDIELSWANLEKALDINPTHESAIRLLCEWAMKDNEIERAIKRLDIFVNRQTDHAHVSMWYAKFLYFSGRLEAGLLEIEKALYLEPSLEGAMEVLSVIKQEISNREAKATK